MTSYSGTADSDDFVAVAGTLTFAIGQTTATVAVTVNGDTSFETDETVEITFSGSQLVASVTDTGTIANNDVDPTTVAQTFVLTTALNTFTGGSGDDVFDASIVNTLSAGDVLVGDSGDDTLTALLNTTTTTVNSTGIELFNLTNITGASTVNMAGASGVTGIANLGSTANLTLNNLASIPTIDINTNASTTTLNFSDAAMSGVDDLAINVDGVAAATITLTSAAGGGCTEFCVNGLMTGNRRISRSGYDLKHKESSTQRSHRQFAG